MALSRGSALLVEALKAKALSFNAFERELNCSSGLVSLYASGQRTPGLANALAIEKLLGIPASAWVESSDGAAA